MLQDRKISFIHPTYIDVAEELEGEGTLRNPWRLTQEKLSNCVRKLCWTRKVIYFRSGIFFSENPILLDFQNIFGDDPDAREMLREGVAFRGEARGSIIQMGTHRDHGRASFQLKWGRPPGEGHSFQTPLFFWEFVGLGFKGDTDNCLVQLGGDDVEESPWNSCEFKITANNGFMDPQARYRGETGPARGVLIRRALESVIDLVATCACGIGAALEECEFSTIKGSFSNAEIPAPGTPSGWRVTPHGIGLYMRNCCSNVGLSVNFEVAYFGLRLVGSCRGNSFNSVISNNCDLEGSVVNIDDCATVEEAAATNCIDCLVRRQCRQGGGQHAIQPIGNMSDKMTITMEKL